MAGKSKVVKKALSKLDKRFKNQNSNDIMDLYTRKQILDMQKEPSSSGTKAKLRAALRKQEENQRFVKEMSKRLDLPNTEANKKRRAARAEVLKKADTKQRRPNPISKTEQSGIPSMSSVKGRSALELSEAFMLPQLQMLHQKATDSNVKAKLTRAINKRRNKYKKRIAEREAKEGKTDYGTANRKLLQSIESLRRTEK